MHESLAAVPKPSLEVLSKIGGVEIRLGVGSTVGEDPHLSIRSSFEFTQGVVKVCERRLVFDRDPMPQDGAALGRKGSRFLRVRRRRFFRIGPRVWAFGQAPP
jgi:hypothetical protein